MIMHALVFLFDLSSFICLADVARKKIGQRESVLYAVNVHDGWVGLLSADKLMHRLLSFIEDTMHQHTCGKVLRWREDAGKYKYKCLIWNEYEISPR